MSQLKQIKVVGSSLVDHVRALHETVRQHGRRNRNLMELRDLDRAFLDDIGLSEYTRSQIIRSS